MSDPNLNPLLDFLREEVVAIEKLGGEVRALNDLVQRHQASEEKAIKDLRAEILTELRKHNEQVGKVIALWEAQQAEEIRQTDRRDKAVSAFFSHPTVQWILIGIVFVVLNLLGLSGLAQMYLSNGGLLP